jgi:hypothetical protein
MLEKIFRFLFGLNATERINDAAAHNGRYYALTAMKDSVIAAATTPNTTGDLAGLSIPAGVTIYGQFESVTFNAGADVYAYKL